jgi:hypothetical protein
VTGSAEMAKVTVSPEEFHLVVFDAGEIAAIVEALADRLDLADHEINVEVDERTPLGSSALRSLDPITVSAESGAFEDARHIRHLSRQSVEGVMGRHLLRARDRLDPNFGDPPSDDELSIALHAAWDAYAVGRLVGLGYPTQEGRRRYHFRIRHGFTDTADRVFDRLWAADGLTWADIVAASEEAMAAKPAEPGKRARAKAAQGRT